MGFRRYDRRRREPQQRVNHRIRVPEVRVIDANGDMLGVLATHEALSRARAQSMDLVEINPKANPPVCKILDFGKYKYDEKKRKRETKKKQSTVEVKEIKLRPKTDDHDLGFKSRAARKFIESGNKVKFTVRFRGREITHPHKAREQLDWIIGQCDDVANVEVRPIMEGRTMTMIISPKPGIMQAVSNARADAERERKEAEVARLAAKGRRSSKTGASQPGASGPGAEASEKKRAPAKAEEPAPDSAALRAQAKADKAKAKADKAKAKADKVKADKAKADKAKAEKAKAAKAAKAEKVEKAKAKAALAEKAKAEKAEKTAKAKAAKAAKAKAKAKVK